MALQHSIWQVGPNPRKLGVARLDSEKVLEEMIAADPTILSEDWMLIGRQVHTTHGGYIDLLAVAPDGSLVIIELKRDRTPREVVAQALDYASWVRDIDSDDIAAVYDKFLPGRSLIDDFRSRFHTDLDETTLNESHQIVIVASELDPSSERIVGYLSDLDIPINVLFFQVFQNGEEQLLSRAWLIDPTETQLNTSTSVRGQREPWNGEFYVSFGDPVTRSWADAREYGFISAGGKPWFSKTLSLLSPGDRVWVKIPKTGFVGVGRVTGEVVPARDFYVTDEDGSRKRLADTSTRATYLRDWIDDDENCEYFVPVQWLTTVPEEEAVNQVGMFGNQNSVCKPVAPKWRSTVERLKQAFPDHD